MAVALISAGATIVAALVTGAAGIATGYLSVNTTGSANEPVPTVTVTQTVTASASGDADGSDGSAGIASPDPVAAQERIRLSPDRGVAGGTFTVIGEGFEPGEQVRIEWDGQDLRDAEASGQGTFEVEVTVQVSSLFEDLGSHTVTAAGLESGRVAEHLFVVLEEE